MLIGYDSISTHEQHLDLHKDALEKAGYEKLTTRQSHRIRNLCKAPTMKTNVFKLTNISNPGKLSYKNKAFCLWTK